MNMAMIGSAENSVEKKPKPIINLDIARRPVPAGVKPVGSGEEAPPIIFSKTTEDSASQETPIELTEARLTMVGALVLTQTAVGIFILYALLKNFHPAQMLSQNQYMISAGLTACFIALGLCLMNLAQRHELPGTRWRRRTYMAFCLFLGSATLYSLIQWGAAKQWNWTHSLAQGPIAYSLIVLVVGSGMIGLLATTMVCASTNRPTWSTQIVGTKFALTALLLGLAVTQLAMTLAGHADQLSLALPALMLCAVTKGTAEYHFLKGRKARRTLHLRRVVKLLTQHLGWMTRTRFVLALICGIILPSAALIWGCCAWIAWLVLLGLLTEELFERYQFFACTCASTRSA